mmetsp:Transcript_38167/g.99111  ORF Transcript_38167/g.99111 Transcript_38167/m.99111 type:complete len:270 (+) Transcript_38167:520-1329(+)
MRVAVHEARLLEAQLGLHARRLVHHPHDAAVVDAELADDEVVDGGDHLVPVVHLAVRKRHLQRAHRVQLDAAAPELALHLAVALEEPAAALAAGGEDGRVVAHLLADVTQPLFRGDKLKGFAQQRVERLAGAAHGGGVAAGGKGGDVHQPCLRARLALARHIQQLAVLHVLRALLQRADGLVEKDRQADAREVLPNAFPDDGPQADALLPLLGRRQPASSLRRLRQRQHVLRRPGDVSHAVQARPHGLRGAEAAASATAGGLGRRGGSA